MCQEAWIQYDAGDLQSPGYLNALKSAGIDYFIVLPIKTRDDRLFALLSMGLAGDMVYGTEDREYLRGFCDHLAVVFSNSSLIQELKELNLGALHALAHTVDANSSWTAGHSDRVTTIAADIAAAMGYHHDRLDELRRAGLLHDIGKIGIPLSILDKNGQLTHEEFAIIKKHPSIGAHILSPIRAFAGLIPIVEQHHERFDGKGYPYGYGGEHIHSMARILSVADSFDAMVSDRPYRKGLSVEKALDIIRAEAGRQFDPQVVDAFFQVIQSKSDQSTRWSEGCLHHEHTRQSAQMA